VQSQWKATHLKVVVGVKAKQVGRRNKAVMVMAVIMLLFVLLCVVQEDGDDDDVVVVSTTIIHPFNLDPSPATTIEETENNNLTAINPTVSPHTPEKASGGGSLQQPTL